MKSERGFSLIELVITVAVVFALSAIAILYTPGMVTGYKVRGATRLIYSDMQMARLRAIKEGREWAVEFSGTTYCVKSKGADAAWTAGCATAADTIVKTVDLANEYSGVGVVPTASRIEFNPNGTATSASITNSKDSRVQTLCIRSGTGNIRIVNCATCTDPNCS